MPNNRCVNCGTITTALNNWHAICPNCRLYASSLGADGGTGIDGLEDLRKSNFDILLSQLEATRPLAGLTLLEVGCSKGLFLEAALSRGIKTTGIEPEIAMADQARAKGLEVFDGFFPDAMPAGATYDIIVFNDVFEHLPDPTAALVACQSHLRRNGSLLINLPSSDGAFYRISKLFSRLGWSGPYERLWQKGFPSPHTFYFNPKNLRELVEKSTGLRLEYQHSLPSVHRKGTRERVRSTYKGLSGEIVTLGVVCLSFVLPLLPSDISVTHFRSHDT
ncbi:class I SAM-dependent methyltransferase [uncultured Ruegeria sp.]|uniref:class I SAM-dependent methyltransferase n=1 Tax=uncultured Ruegeria sp. TaxID=259304 RepID=UPI002618BB79|nr:class I SAM-dependent methyltransferase [uncultured Ruegeria sp.]